MKGATRLPRRRLAWRAFVNLLLLLVFGAILGTVFIVSALASGGAG